jgi:hypothetical protein
MAISLAPVEYPVDRVITDSDGYMALCPNLPVDEIQGLQESGLSCDEDGEPIIDFDDPLIPAGWRVIEADDMSLFLPEEIL